MKRPPGTRVLRNLTIFAGVLCSTAFVAGLVMFFFADRQSKALGLVPGDVFWGRAGMQFFLLGILGPFVFWSAHSGIALWVNEAGQWFTGNWGKGVNIAGSVAFALLSGGLAIIVLLPLLFFAPNEGRDLWDLIPAIFVAMLCGAVAVAAVAGGIALFQSRGAWAGAVLGLGFLVMVLSGTWQHLEFIEESWFTRLLAPLGVLLLVAGTGLFWFFRVVEARKDLRDAQGKNPAPGAKD